MKLSTRRVTARMRAPFYTAHGAVTERPLVLVRLTAADGLVGIGEAAPLAGYDGVTIDEVLAALQECAPVLEAYPGHAPVADVVARCAERTVVAPALAAIDLALWDLAGRRAREPLWRLLGAGGRDSVPLPVPIAVNRTIAAPDRSGAAREAAQARADGYGTVKVKVGLGDDPARVAAVRAFAGPQMAIRLDANGAWSPDQAWEMLEVLAPAQIECCEEPVAGVEAIRSLWHRRPPVALAVDESAGDPGALIEPAADLMCLKISRCGGVSGLLDAAARARGAGYEVFLASTLDGPLGIAAALHAAAVIRPTRASGLATLGLFAGRPDVLPVARGAIAAPHGPGLGDGLADWY